VAQLVPLLLESELELDWRYRHHHNLSELALSQQLITNLASSYLPSNYFIIESLLHLERLDAITNAD
jgi:hypothetical protein